jgi:hypothetical protein
MSRGLPGCGRDRRRGAALGPVAFSGAGAGGARLLIDRIAVAPGARGAGSAEARQRPGRARGVGDARAHGQAEIGAVGLHLGEQRLLPAEEMGAAGEVDHQAIGRRLRHPGAELARPAAQRGEKRGLSRRVGDAGDEVGAERHRLAQRLAPIEAACPGRAFSAATWRRLPISVTRRAACRPAPVRAAAPGPRRGAGTRATGCGGTCGRDGLGQQGA